MTIIATGIRRTQEAQYGGTATITCQGEHGGKVLPVTAGATVTAVANIYRPGYETAELSSVACTVDATTSIATCSFSVASTSTYILAESYVASFIFTETVFPSSTTYEPRKVLFDVVRTPIIYRCPVNANHLRRVHAEFDGAFSQLSMTDATIARDFVMPAWEEVLSAVETHGWRPSLVSSPDSLALHCQLAALVKVARYLMRSPNDLRAKLLEEFKAEKDAVWAGIGSVLRYQEGDSFNTSKVKAWAQPYFTIGPDRRVHR